MESPRRVLFFCIDSENFGGGSKMVARLLRNLDRDVVDPVVLVQERGALYENLADPEAGPETEIHVVPFGGILRENGLMDRSLLIAPFVAARILQYNWRVRHLLRSADVVWCENLRAVLAVTPLAAVVPAPVVWNVGLGRRSRGLYRYLHAVAFAVADRVFFESELKAERIFGPDQLDAHRAKLTHFYKGIDTARFDPGRVSGADLGPGLHVGTAASITPRKGLEQFVEAASDIATEHDDVSFHVAGKPFDDAYGERVRAMTASAGLDDRVTFHGWVAEMPAYLASLDVFVLTSRNEGIPGVVREALAMEVPVVATDVGGTADAVLDGETGFLVEVDDRRQTAARIRQLLADPDLRQAFGEAGRRHVVENFSLDSYVSAYEEFLAEI